MPIKELSSHHLGMDEDWEGNNAAFRCPVCGKVFIVNSTRMHHGRRQCPNCRKSIARIAGGRKGGGKATIEWPDSEGKTLIILKNEFRRAASASLENAAALYEDASLLFGAHRFARSLSLSVIGLEEIGKSLLYVLAVLDCLPDLWPKLEGSKRSNPAHVHVSKQLLEKYAGIASWQIGEYLQILGQEAGELSSVSDVGHLTEFFTRLISNPFVGAKVIKPTTSDQKLLTMNERKERGLYVNLSPEFGLSAPEQIDAKEAEPELADLRSSLNDFKVLCRVLNSDQEWQLLENAFKERC